MRKCDNEKNQFLKENSYFKLFKNKPSEKSFDSSRIPDELKNMTSISWIEIKSSFIFNKKLNESMEWNETMK